jgi:hypothetical protein
LLSDRSVLLIGDDDLEIASDVEGMVPEFVEQAPELVLELLVYIAQLAITNGRLVLANEFPPLRLGVLRFVGSERSLKVRLATALVLQNPLRGRVG